MENPSIYGHQQAILLGDARRCWGFIILSAVLSVAEITNL
jgi:hypothetical protein